MNPANTDRKRPFDFDNDDPERDNRKRFDSGYSSTTPSSQCSPYHSALDNMHDWNNTAARSPALTDPGYNTDKYSPVRSEFSSTDDYMPPLTLPDVGTETSVGVTNSSNTEQSVGATNSSNTEHTYMQEDTDYWLLPVPAIYPQLIGFEGVPNSWESKQQMIQPEAHWPSGEPELQQNTADGAETPTGTTKQPGAENPTGNTLYCYNTDGATNFEHVTYAKDDAVIKCPKTDWATISGEMDLKDFMEGLHMSQKINVVYKERGISRSSTYDLNKLLQGGLINLIRQHKTIHLRAKEIDEKRYNKFVQQDKTTKRSIAKCDNIVRGLALAQEWDVMEKDSKLTAKQRNNQFTTLQRTDRGAGPKLQETFSADYGLTEFPEYVEIENKCGVSVMVFDSRGFITYFSRSWNSECVWFLNNDSDYYYIKNPQGFCRID